MAAKGYILSPRDVAGLRRLAQRVNGGTSPSPIANRLHRTATSSTFRWNGRVRYLGGPKWDFTREDAAVGGDLLDGGLAEALEGIYLKIKLADGSYEWSDEVADPIDYDLWNYYQVADRSGAGTEEDPYTYTPASGHFNGEIRIEYAPWVPEPEPEPEE
jgi:hypothetical protein